MEIVTLIREAQYSAAQTCRRLDLFAHAREVRFHIALVPPVIEKLLLWGRKDRCKKVDDL